MPFIARSTDEEKLRPLGVEAKGEAGEAERKHALVAPMQPKILR